MGIQVSFPNVQEGNLIFPVEVLEEIINHLSVRDRLIARQVCCEWRDFIDSGQSVFVDKVIVRVEHSEESVRFLEQSEVGMVWSAFSFKSVEFTRNSLSFWSAFTDQITHIDFYDCTFPQSFFSTPNTGNDASTKSCPSLKHLGLRNCNKYLMMGKAYFHLHNFLNLENLSSLDVSENAYLNDFALLMLATSSQHLKSINLRKTNMSFTQAVFNRFYPRDKIFNNYAFRGEDSWGTFRDFSDNILTFHMLYFAYLSTPAGQTMEELIFDETRVDSKALRLVVDSSRFSWKSIRLNRCAEIKQADFIEFISSQTSLELLEIGCSKIDPSQLGQNLQYLSKLQHLVMHGCGEARKTEFLQAFPHLSLLDVSSCASLEFNAEDFANLKKLKVLRMRGITPFYAMNYNNVEKAAVMVRIIQVLPQLVELDIGDCGSALTDTVMQKIIQHMPHLQLLKVCQSKITDRGLAGIEIDEIHDLLRPSPSSRKRAETPEGTSNSSPPEGACLSQLTRLRTLSLSKCQGLGEASWRLALRLPNLQHLDLSSCWQLSVTGFSSIITQCPSLESLNIVSCGVHIGQNQELLDLARQQLTRLRHLLV